jgi:septal ring factor EnvC (AmiA/AmiB activator)
MKKQNINIKDLELMIKKQEQRVKRIESTNDKLGKNLLDIRSELIRIRHIGFNSSSLLTRVLTVVGYSFLGGGLVWVCTVVLMFLFSFIIAL